MAGNVRAVVFLALVANGTLISCASRGKLGYTPMMNAAAIGDEEKVRRALADGADSNTRARVGSSELMRAALGGHLRIVEILLDAGANPNFNTRDGLTATKLASLGGHTDIANRLSGSPPGPAPNREAAAQLKADHDEITPPRLLKRVQPSFTDYALDHKAEGEVVVEVVILKSGETIPRRILKSLELGLDLRAIQAARQWRFEPALLNGTPVDLIAEIVVDFNIL